MLVAAGILAYSAVAALFEPMTWPTRIATALPILALLAGAVHRGWSRPRMPVARRRRLRPGAAAVWVILIGAVIAVQLLNFVAEPREIYPTLSSLAQEVLDLYPLRAAMFVGWIGAGWYLVGR